MTTLLVTNDFPPKVGGIQSYLFELWRRLPADRHAILTRKQSGSEHFDASFPLPVRRLHAKTLWPTPRIASDIRSFADEVNADFLLFDPALPIGLLGPRLDRPYGVILHGSEVTVPARLPIGKALLRRVLLRASLVVAAGSYPAREARRVAGNDLVDPFVIPPGVDASRFRPLDAETVRSVRTRFGLPPDGRVVVGVSRLVPRKGFDVLIEASATLAGSHPDLAVVVAGGGRDEPRLAKLIRRLDAPVRLLGRVSDAELPLLVGSADVAAMLCRTRWLGLEQEGFGIVFLEAAAAGVPQVAGRSGGSHEAVVDGVTGIVVDRPGDVVVAAQALARVLDDAALRRQMGAAGRKRAIGEFDCDDLARRLDHALELARVGGAGTR